jgi:hypothetical protein
VVEDFHIFTLFHEEIPLGSRTPEQISGIAPDLNTPAGMQRKERQGALFAPFPVRS